LQVNKSLQTANLSKQSSTPRADKVYSEEKHNEEGLMVAPLFAVLMVLPVSSRVYAQGATLTGQWQVLRDGKSETRLLTLSQSGDSIAGKWAPAKGAASEIENGKIAGDTLTFSFIHDKKRFNATGHLSGDTISFDIIGPKKWGMTKTIHGKAARGDMQ
jgi:hypothetical protein